MCKENTFGLTYLRGAGGHGVNGGLVVHPCVYHSVPTFAEDANMLTVRGERVFISVADSGF